MASDLSVERQYRASDREEENAPDRYSKDLRAPVIARVRACQT
jgi:hypothetical protein